MKKFSWPLQRLLDVTEQRESVARSALLAVTQTIAARRGKVLSVQSRQRELLEGLAAADMAQRLVQQDLVMSAADKFTKQLRALEAELLQLTEQRKAKTAELMQIRSRRQVLEKLRAAAVEQWRQEQNRQEQKQLDEVASVAFARKAASLAGGR